MAAEPLPKPIEVEYSLRFRNLRRLDPSNVEATHRVDFDADYDLTHRPAGRAAEGRAAGDAGPLGRRQARAHDDRRDQAVGPRLLQSVLGGEAVSVPLPEGDHTFRLGFIDDPFVKTLAKENIYKDTTNKWIGSMTIIGPFPSKEEKPSRRSVPGLRSEDRRGVRRQDPVDAGAARLPPAGDAGRGRVAEEVRRRMAQADGPVGRAGHRRSRFRRCWCRRTSCSTSSAISTRPTRRRCIGSPTSSWRRG